MSYRDEVISPGDRVSRLGHAVCVNSRGNNNVVRVVAPEGEHFRGLVGWRWSDRVLMSMVRHKVCETVQSDGAGGKPQFFTALNRPDAFYNLGWEIIAMCADDIACGGGLPVLMASSNIDVKQVTEQNFPMVEALMEGFGQALCTSRLVLMTGETAVMKHSITAFCDDGSPGQLVLTWGGTCLGLMRDEADHWRRPKITPGMAIVGFKERGYRCNGGTALTRILQALREAPSTTSAKFGLELTEESVSYATTLARLNGWQDDGRVLVPEVEIAGMAHITGGGVWGKLGDLLPAGVGAELGNMPEPPTILKMAQDLSHRGYGELISDYACYDTFHGGCGVMLICREEDVKAVIHEASMDGHDAQLVGITTASQTSEINILSRFADGKVLSSHHPE